MVAMWKKARSGELTLLRADGSCHRICFGPRDTTVILGWFEEIGGIPTLIPMHEVTISAGQRKAVQWDGAFGIDYK